MSKIIVQRNERGIKGQIRELARGSEAGVVCDPEGADRFK